MTQAPSRVRAVARVGGAPQRPASPVVLIRRRGPGRLGWFNLGQLLLVEALLLAVLAATGISGWLVIVAAVLGLAVVGVAFGRRNGRWWLERMILTWRIRQRRGADPGRHPDPRMTALRTLAPDLSVSTHQSSDGERIGVASDESGWFAMAAVTQPPVRGDTFVRLPLDRLSQALREMGQPGSVVQLVVQSVPAPTSEIDPRNRCIVSYRELLEKHGAVPADRTVWLAVRIEAQPFVAAWVDESDPVEQAPAIAAALIRRMGRVMRRDGLGYQPLDADGLLDSLVRSLDLEQCPPQGPSGESWSHWQSVHLAHACFWVSDWPAPDRAAAMLERLATVPAVFTSVSFVLDARDQFTDFRCLVRVAAGPHRLALSSEAVEDIARQFGARVLRLDGEQAPAAYASAPTGGGPQ